MADQTGGFVVINVTGQKDTLKTRLTKLLNIDPHALTAGCAVRTGLDHMTVFVLRQNDTTLTALGMRSFATSLWQSLTTACAQFGHDDLSRASR